MSEQTLTEFVAKRAAEYAKLGIYGERADYSAKSSAFHVFEGELVRERDGKFIRPNYAKPRGATVAQSAYVRYIALNPYSWPGGGEIFAIMDDGAEMCRACVLKRAKSDILPAGRSRYRHTGWRIVALKSTYNCEPDSAIYCADCSRAIQEPEQEQEQEQEG